MGSDPNTAPANTAQVRSSRVCPRVRPTKAPRAFRFIRGTFSQQIGKAHGQDPGAWSVTFKFKISYGLIPASSAALSLSAPDFFFKPLIRSASTCVVLNRHHHHPGSMTEVTVLFRSNSGSRRCQSDPGGQSRCNCMRCLRAPPAPTAAQQPSAAPIRPACRS